MDHSYKFSIHGLVPPIVIVREALFAYFALFRVAFRDPNALRDILKNTRAAGDMGGGAQAAAKASAVRRARGTVPRQKGLR